LLGFTETIIIAGVIGVFCFGPMFLRKTGTAVGETIREFRKVKKELGEPLTIDGKDTIDETVKK